jgi:hypothetical protein
MPRNTIGGSGHRAQRNSEGSKARNNRLFVDDLLDDYKNDEQTEGVYVGRVLRRMGCGRMEVFYMENMKGDDIEAGKLISTQKIMPMRGGLRGKGKKAVWVDVGALVMIAETGLAGTTHEIVAVFSPEQVARLRKFKPDSDERLFLKEGVEGADSEMGGFVIEEGEDVDVDAI